MPESGRRVFRRCRRPRLLACFGMRRDGQFSVVPRTSVGSLPCSGLPRATSIGYVAALSCTSCCSLCESSRSPLVKNAFANVWLGQQVPREHLQAPAAYTDPRPPRREGDAGPVVASNVYRDLP